MIDFCAAAIIVMRFDNALSRVTRSFRRRSHCLIQQRVWQPLSSTENPLRWSYPLSSMAGLQAQVKAVVSHVKGCIRSVTNLTLSSSISRLACFPDSTMPFTDCIVLWSGGCRHELTTHVLKPLSDLVLDFSSLVTNQPSWHARQSVSDRDPERDGRWERGLRTPQRQALKCVVSTGSQSSEEPSERSPAHCGRLRSTTLGPSRLRQRVIHRRQVPRLERSWLLVRTFGCERAFFRLFGFFTVAARACSFRFGDS